MKITKPFVFSALMALTVNVHAGLYNLTIHSRANCLNNESITWWYGNKGNWSVKSVHHHIPTDQWHEVATGWQYNDRVAAIHWGEGVHAGFEVWGYHYFPSYYGVSTKFTYTTTCDIIDGWI